MIHYEVTNVTGIPSLEVTGSMATGDAFEFEKKLQKLCEETDESVILDMRQCPYLPSLGIPPLIKASEKLKKENRHFFMLVHEELMDILRVLRLDKALSLFVDVDNCVNAVKKARRLG